MSQLPVDFPVLLSLVPVFSIFSHFSLCEGELLLSTDPSAARLEFSIFPTKHLSYADFVCASSSVYNQ